MEMRQHTKYDDRIVKLKGDQIDRFYAMQAEGNSTEAGEAIKLLHGQWAERSSSPGLS